MESRQLQPADGLERYANDIGPSAKTILGLGESLYGVQLDVALASSRDCVVRLVAGSPPRLVLEGIQ